MEIQASMRTSLFAAALWTPRLARDRGLRPPLAVGVGIVVVIGFAVCGLSETVERRIHARLVVAWEQTCDEIERCSLIEHHSHGGGLPRRDEHEPVVTDCRIVMVGVTPFNVAFD